MSSESGAAILVLNNADLVISNWLFKQCTTHDEGGTITLYESHLVM